MDPATQAPVTLTRVLHPCVLVDGGAARVLIDPCFGTFTRRGPVSRLFGVTLPEPGIAPEEMIDLTVLALTHGHEDHFDADGVSRLPSRETRVITAEPGLARKLRRLGFRTVDVVRPWESVSGDGWEITAVPARSPFGGGLASLAASIRVARGTVRR